MWEQGWTQERIGKALGVDRSTISRWFPVCNITNHNSDNFPTPTQNLEAIISEWLAEEHLYPQEGGRDIAI